jgi:hypothetical protein
MYVQPEKILGMFQNICQRHQGEIQSAYLDWEVQSVYSARYDQKIEHLVPIFVVDFK